MSFQRTVLAEGAEGIFVKNTRFNTTLVAFNFYLPLSEENVANNALLPFVLSTCSKEYSDFSKLNFQLSKLYGAELTASAEKIGDYQLLKLAVSVINDKFTLDGEILSEKAMELLLKLIFEPKVFENKFCSEDVEREKRKAIEHIMGEFSEKRLYSKKRLISEMYKGTPYGISKCGTAEQVEKITGETLYSAWKNMLRTAFIRVNVISNSCPAGLFDSISDKLNSSDRNNITDVSLTAPTNERDEVLRVTENQELNQGKLVMGFSSSKFGGDTDTADLFVACDIFGGGPYSKLFCNVREKMSLCYYCAARAVRIKGLVTVESGIELKNAEKAQNAILEQLKELQNGNVTDEEFNFSVLGLTDSLKSYNDSQGALEMWYSTRISDKEILSPDEFTERVKNVTKEQAINASKGIKLNTVFLLLPKEAE